MKKIKQFIQETEKEFDSKLLNLGIMLEKKDELIVKSFISDRQLKLWELAKGCVPKGVENAENIYITVDDEQYSGLIDQKLALLWGFNSCRSQTLKNMEGEE